MTEHSRCILCNSEKLIPLEGYQKAFLCKCANCRLVFSKKKPSIEELKEFYKNYGVNSYLSPLTIKRYHELLDQFENYRKTNRILDLGCGTGFFLEEAKKRGWEVYGTELSTKAGEICTQKGIHIHYGTLDSATFDRAQFDVITSFEMIEHINYPQTEIRNMMEFLRKGGLLYVTTPNFNSLLRYRLKAKYNIITYPEHLVYYTRKTLRFAMKQGGFTHLKTETTGISITRFKTSKGVSQQRIISAGSDDEILRKRFDEKRHLKLGKSIINAALTILGIGDSLKGWFIKP